MRGRNSVVISIRVSDSVYATIKGLADTKGMSVSAYVKQKVEDYALRVNTTKETVHSVNQKQDEGEVVNTMGSVNAIPKMKRVVSKGGVVFEVPER